MSCCIVCKLKLRTLSPQLYSVLLMVHANLAKCCLMCACCLHAVYKNEEKLYLGNEDKIKVVVNNCNTSVSNLSFDVEIQMDYCLHKPAGNGCWWALRSTCLGIHSWLKKEALVKETRSVILAIVQSP